jgi:hypothetical protein
MALLDVVQSVAVRLGLGKPAAAASSTDTNILQMVEYANEAGQELAKRYSWQALNKEATFICPGAQGGILTLKTLVGGSGYNAGLSSLYNLVPLTGGTGTGALAQITVTNGVVTACNIAQNSQGAGYTVGDVLSASPGNLGGSGSGFSVTVATTGYVGIELQGTIQALTGPDFGTVTNETMWDRTTRRPVYGPKYAAEWQQLKAQLMQGPWWQYRIRGNQLLFIPPPSPGDQIYFEWISLYWVANAVTPTTGSQTAYVLDTDVAILDEQAIKLDTLWRYKASKGLNYTEDQDKAEAAIADLMTRDGAAPRLNLAGAQSDIYPGVLVPAGNWGH